MFVPGELLVAGEVGVFLFEGGGDALDVEEGAGVGVGKDAFAGDAGCEVVDAFPDEGNAGEVAEEGGCAVFAEFFGGVVVLIVFVVVISGVPEGVDEPADEGGGDAEGEPALDGGDAVPCAAAFPLGDDEAEFVDLFASHDVGEAGEEAACGLSDAFLGFGEGLGSEFEGVADLPEGGCFELVVGVGAALLSVEFFRGGVVRVGEGVHGEEVGFDINFFDEGHGFFRELFEAGVSLAGELVGDLGEDVAFSAEAGFEPRGGGEFADGDVARAEFGACEVVEVFGEADVAVGEFAGSVGFFEDGGGDPACEEAVHDGGGLFEEDEAVACEDGVREGALEVALEAGEVEEGAVVFEGGAVDEVEVTGEFVEGVLPEVEGEFLVELFVAQEGAPVGGDVGGVDVVVLFGGGGEEDEGGGFTPVEVFAVEAAGDEHSIFAAADGAVGG